MAKCPIDGTELIQFVDDPTFWECPADKSRWLPGTWSLVQMQRAVVSIASTGGAVITNFYKDATQKMATSNAKLPSNAETYISLIASATAITI